MASPTKQERLSTRQAALIESISSFEAVEAAAAQSSSGSQPAARRPLEAPVKPDAAEPHQKYGHGSLAARMAALRTQAEYSVARGVVDEQTLNERMQGLDPTAGTPRAEAPKRSPKPSVSKLPEGAVRV